MSGDSSRKPSGSSTHSGGRSPTNGPNNPQRKITPTGTGNMLGVGMGGTNGLKALNSGWQVWGSGSPSSKRKPTSSSPANGNDLSPSYGDPAYRNNFGETWSSSRPTSGNWEDVGPQQLQESHSPLNLHPARQREAQTATFSGPRIDERSSGPVNGQYPPQRYDGMGKETGNQRYATSAPPPKGFGGSSYTTQPGLQAPPSAGGYDGRPTNVEDLSMALRGMVVEDDYGARQQQQQSQSSQPPPTQSNPQFGPPPPMPQPRGAYGNYPQDLGSYYSMQTAREPYVEYQYGFDAYRGPVDPSLYASPVLSNASPAAIYQGMAQQSMSLNGVADIRQQPGMYYEYGAPRPNGSQYFYATPQAMMFPTPSPMLAPQVGPSNPSPQAEKKRENQYNIQQQLAAQAALYGTVRSTPSPHPQVYGGSIDYGSGMALMMPGGPMYGGPNPPGMHSYPQGVRPGRRDGPEHLALSLRSALLDEFRSNKSRKWDLKDVQGHIVEFSGDQHGSRFIQQRLESASSEEKQLVFDEIVPSSALQLITDVFGNYVIQKLFEHGTQVHKTMLASTMEGHVLQLSLQMYGCRVVQKAVEYILPDQQAVFVRELEGHALRCVKDANGNHVIQKIIERVSPDRLGFVGSFIGHVFDLSSHPYGCRVLQRCFEHLPEEQSNPLLEELHQSTINLMQDQFGNYVIQFVIEHGRPQDKAQVLAKLHGSMLQMSRHKFASNVCEKALTHADSENRRILIDEIMTPKQDHGTSPIVTMMKDQYANYVLQRAVVVAEGGQKEALIGKIRPQLLAMRRFSTAYSKHLVSIERLLQKYTTNPHSEPAQDTSVVKP